MSDHDKDIDGLTVIIENMW